MVLCGDVLDFAFIGSFSQDNIKQLFLDGECWDKQWETGQKFLDDLRAAVGPKCKITYIQGNHEHRAVRIVEKDPTRKGSVEVPKHLELEKRGILWVPFWETGETHRIGKMSYGHGWYTTTHHAQKMVVDYGTNITYGHTHTVQIYTKAFKSDDTAHMGRSIGCLCRRDMPYMRGRPTSWQQAFGVTYFQPDGNFTSYTPTIFNRRFISPEGKLYKG